MSAEHGNDLTFARILVVVAVTTLLALFVYGVLR